MNEQEIENAYNMRKTLTKTVIKAGAFLLVLCLLLSSVCKTLVFRKETAIYNWIRGMYEEQKNSLDAVCIGASSFYRAWVAPVAWNNYGIAVWPFLNPGQPIEAAEDLVREARKTQPDALMIVSTNLLWSSFNEEQLHDALDFLPTSQNKIELTEKLIKLGGYSKEEGKEFYFPLIRFHTRWNELTEADFHYSINGQKGALTEKGFFQSIQNVSDSYHTTARRIDILDRIQEALDSLLDYCDKESVDVLFITTPQVGPDETWLAMYNSVNDYIADRGYPVLNLRDRIKETGLDLTRDYYNPNHTNTHGAFKLTDYLANYLVENYGFKDKRGDPAYADWNEAYELYTKSAARYGCDFEWNGSKRDYSLTAPELTKLAVNGTTLTLSWKAVANADGYCIYRKAAEGTFAPIADVDAETLKYADTECKVGEQYTYTVVSFVEKDGTRYWGTYDFSGLSATAAMNAPGAPELSGSENNLTLVWKGVKGADGYQVFRRVFGKSWIALGEVAGNTTYTDTNMLEDMPYQYRVRVYWLNENGEKVYGSYSKDSLWLPELTGPEVTVSDADGVPTLTWSTVEGITNYTVTRRTADGDWEQIAEPLAADCTQFRDIMAEAGVQYEYQVTANIVYGKKTYPYPSESVSVVAEAEPLALDVPEIVFAEQVGDGVQLVWEPSENATAYRIYRQAAGESEWTVVKGSQSGSTYQDKPPEAGTYIYILKSLRTEDGCTYYGEFDENAGRSVTYSVE